MAGRVDFYEEVDGTAPVEQFLEDLPKKQRALVARMLQVLCPIKKRTRYSNA